jgi:hypothetical protein
VRFQPQVVTEQEVRYFTADPRNNHQEFFYKYASGQPTPAPAAFSPPPTAFNPPPTAFLPANNALNVGGMSQAPFGSSAMAVTATSQYSYSGNLAVQSKPLGGGADSSDFLKKIDEQLQNSRKQFPS